MEYQKYEFCKAKNCWKFFPDKCLFIDSMCCYTAKEFHTWLKENDFKIIKKITSEDLKRK